MKTGKPTKHRQVFEHVLADIESGKLKDGERLPSEAELVKQFASSRPTVARALRDLQNLGLVDRKVGSGTYVRKAQKSIESWRFGLLIPGLGSTEIFEPICGQLARLAQKQHQPCSGEISETGAERRIKTDRTSLQQLHPADSGWGVFRTFGVNRR
jgi:LacI family transcriptional regulator